MFKKVFAFGLVVFILVLTFQYGINYLKLEHEIEYTIVTSDRKFEVSEKYHKNKEEEYYLFKINYSGSEFIIENKNLFNKQKRVIKDIVAYEKDDVICISLIYIQNKEESMPICSKNNELYAYNNFNYDFEEFFNKLPNYKNKENERDNTLSKDKDVEYYKNNFLETENIVLYDQKNLLQINNKEIQTFKFGIFDVYKNEMGFLLDDYYLIPKYTSNPEIINYLVFDLKTGITKQIELPVKLSKNIYINGVYDKKLYIFDKSKMIQLSINPDNREIKVVADKDNMGINFKNGVFEEISVYDLEKEYVKFYSNIDAYKNIEREEFVFEGYFAIYRKGQSVYKVYRDFPDKPILLFKEDGLKELQASYDSVYYIKADKLYRYDKFGTYPLIKREEFKYNYSNIYSLYFK